jgi:hypothetical protein
MNSVVIRYSLHWNVQLLCHEGEDAINPHQISQSDQAECTTIAIRSRVVLSRRKPDQLYN